MIQVKDLIEKFKNALDNDWGYIWGTAGVKWTQAKQDAATREQTVKYGSKWVGHYVADCSGLFSWAFKQLGGYMYHGSNTMFLKYTTASGTLSAGKRTDGQELKEGTAVFVWKEAEKKYTQDGINVSEDIDAQVLDMDGLREILLSVKGIGEKRADQVLKKIGG